MPAYKDPTTGTWFEDYQAIYDKTVEMQGDKEIERSEGGRVR